MVTGTFRVRGTPGMTSAGFVLASSTALLMLAAAAPAVRAELAVFKNGRVLKIESHRDSGERIEIRFPGGGSLTFDRTLLEGIEEDEVARAVQAPPGQAPAAQASATQAPPAQAPATQAPLMQAPPAKAPPLPPGLAEALRLALSEQMVMPTEPEVSAGVPQPSDGNRPSPETRRHGRRHR